MREVLLYFSLSLVEVTSTTNSGITASVPLICCTISRVCGPLGGLAHSQSPVQMSHPKLHPSHLSLHSYCPGGSPGVTVLLTWGPSPGGVPLDGSAHSQSPVQMSHPPNLVGSHVGLQSYCPGGSPGVTVLLTWGPSPGGVPLDGSAHSQSPVQMSH